MTFLEINALIFPVALFIGWLLRKKGSPRIPPPSEGFTLEGSTIMVMSVAPQGASLKTKPKTVLLGFRHSAEYYPVWGLTSHGWAISCNLVPVGSYVLHDKSKLLKHPDPWYRGQASNGVVMKIYGFMVEREMIEAAWAAIREAPSSHPEIRELLVAMGCPETLGQGMGKRRVAHKAADKLLQKWRKENLIEVIPGTHQWRLKEEGT